MNLKLSLIVGAILAGLAVPAHAQGLIWSLPADGTSVRYEGDYLQVRKQNDPSQEDITIQLRRVITLKSVGTEDAEFQGKQQPCRWLEIKSETGNIIADKLEVGPGSGRIYKILVPEATIQGRTDVTVADDRHIHISFIPIIKGFRKIGDNPVEPIESGVFELYPLISLLRHYMELAPEGDAHEVAVPAGSFEAILQKGTMIMETPSQRSTNTAEMERSQKFPFGIAKWTAVSTVEAKGTTENRADFKPWITVTETMEATAIETGAQSELTEK